MRVGKYISLSTEASFSKVLEYFVYKESLTSRTVTQLGGNN